jgi:pyrroline-5-carboxylate reductase
MKSINTHGLVLIGCGFMGKALLQGWLKCGISATSIHVQDPTPSEWLKSQVGLQLNTPLPETPAAIVLATKPQVLETVLPSLARFGDGQTVFISIAAGASISMFEAHLGAQTPIVRAMPNLPASVGQGMTGLFVNTNASPDNATLVHELFAAVGASIAVDDEDQLHLVTGVSGSGPAYVFAVAEAMAQAGERLGLPPHLAKKLAVQTVVGAGAMLAEPNTNPNELRIAVTSKGGTTAAGLEKLMQTPAGISALIHETVDAARKRSVDLSKA